MDNYQIVPIENGFQVVEALPDGRTSAVDGFSTEDDARRWLDSFLLLLGLIDCQGKRFTERMWSDRVLLEAGSLATSEHSELPAFLAGPLPHDLVDFVVDFGLFNFAQPAESVHHRLRLIGHGVTSASHIGTLSPGAQFATIPNRLSAVSGY